MPNRTAQKVFWIGIWTVPFCDKSRNMRSASPGSSTLSVTEKPFACSYRSGGASDPINTSSPTIKRA